jgi:transposase
VSNGTHDATTDALEADLAAARAEVQRLLEESAALKAAVARAGELTRLRKENAELKAVVAEVQKALDAAEADLRRYRDLYEERRPNVPEHVAASDQERALDDVLKDLGVELRSPENDTGGTSGQADVDCPEDGSPPSAPGASPDEPAAPPKRPRKTPRVAPAGGGHGRRNLNASSLPDETVVLDPREVLAARGVGFRLVGAETSYRVAFRPGRYVRLRVIRRTWVRVSPSRRDANGNDASVDSAGQGSVDGGAPQISPALADLASAPDAELITAPIPGSLSPNSFADASAIADALVSKYDDLLPLNRQEKISRREGFPISRSTLCNWFTPTHAVLSRIVEAMFVDAKTAPDLASDATGAQVRPASMGPCETWHVFVFVAEKAHVVFRHTRTHDSVVLSKMLQGFRGTLLGDATSIYSPLVTAGMIVLACCWAHVRRYFFKALESDRARSLEAIAIIGELFDVERVCRDVDDADKTSKRAALARPVLKLFDQWLDRERPRVDPRSPLHAAIQYADNQREELHRFLQDGRLRIDNNVCEGLLRNLVLGLNNWRYFQTETGLRWYTTFRSLIASCHMHEICPQRYLECVLRLAPHWSQRRMLELSPKYWRATAAKLTPEQVAIVRPSWSTAFDAFAATASATAAEDGGSVAA